MMFYKRSVMRYAFETNASFGINKYSKIKLIGPE